MIKITLNELHTIYNIQITLYIHHKHLIKNIIKIHKKKPNLPKLIYYTYIRNNKTFFIYTKCVTFQRDENFFIFIGIFTMNLSKMFLDKFLPIKTPFSTLKIYDRRIKRIKLFRSFT